MRRELRPDLGFSKEDWDANARRIGFVALLPARHGVLVLVPVIAPYATSREAVTRLHEECGATYLEPYVATSPKVCAARDVKGRYAAQAADRISNLTGVDDPYEAPASPDLAIDAGALTVDQPADLLYGPLESRGLV